MIHTLNEFFKTWQHESESTLKVFKNLTDESLSVRVYEGGRTLGRLANHIVETLSEIPSKLDLGIVEKHPVFTTAKELAEAYERDSAALIAAIKINGLTNTSMKNTICMERIGKTAFLFGC